MFEKLRAFEHEIVQVAGKRQKLLSEKGHVHTKAENVKSHISSMRSEAEKMGGYVKSEYGIKELDSRLTALENKEKSMRFRYFYFVSLQSRG